MVLEILVGRDQQSEICILGGLQQFSILQSVPAALECRVDRVPGQVCPERDGRALIEENAQLGGGDRTTRGVREDRAYLIERDAGKPF